jgi:hypothetical protein
LFRIHYQLQETVNVKQSELSGLQRDIAMKSSELEGVQKEMVVLSKAHVASQAVISELESTVQKQLDEINALRLVEEV